MNDLSPVCLCTPYKPYTFEVRFAEPYEDMWWPHDAPAPGIGSHIYFGGNRLLVTQNDYYPEGEKVYANPGWKTTKPFVVCRLIDYPLI